MQYTDKTAVQNYLLTNIDSSFNSQISDWITAMSRYISRVTNRDFTPPGEEDTSKVYDGMGTATLIIDDVLEITTLEIENQDDPVDDADYVAYPANKTPKTKIILRNTTFPGGLQNVTVTGKFGYAEVVPEDIKWACTVLVAGVINMSNSHQGEVQSETIGTYSVTYSSEKQLNDFASAKEIIRSYKRYAI